MTSDSDPAGIEALEQAREAIASTIRKCEKVQPRLKSGTAQHTLLLRRIRAFTIASELITRELGRRAGEPEFTFVVGLTGSGKTTYASKLARERQVLRFSIDEWMKALFWSDAPNPPSLDWALERVRRCGEQIAGLLAQQVALRRGAVLDLGFSKAHDRERWKRRCESMGARVTVVYLDVPRDERWKRVERRNANVASAPDSVRVDRATFDWMESFFEPLSPEERAGATVLTG